MQIILFLMQRFIWIVFLLGFFAASRTESRTLRQDLDDLMDIQKLVYDSNVKLKGWNQDSDPCGDVVPCGINHLPSCNWEGIACYNEDGDDHRIVGIEIQGRSPFDRLTGALPATLPLSLKSISLPSNALRGNLLNPDCGVDFRCSDIWWRNKELKNINVKGNQIEGPLPKWETLHKLESIQLSNNHINGTLPDQWNEKIHLSHVDVSSNQLSGALPDAWASLTDLQFIRIAQNQFEKQIPAGWFQLPSLVLLDVAGNCGMCGEVPDHGTFAIYGSGTNLNTACEQCNGCECKHGQLMFVVTNVLLSAAVLAVMFLVWFIYRCCKRQEESQQLPLTEFVPQMMPRKPRANPTIVINPDQDVCICCPVVEATHSASETEETSDTDGYSEGDSSEYSSFSDTKSIDPKVLAFLYKKSPMLALAERTWSEEIAGPSEIRPEGYASDLDGISNSSGLRQRRSKSALEGSSQKKLSRDFLDSRKSAKRVAELAPTPKHPKNRHRRRRVRTFRRRNRRGLAGDFTISEPQPSIKLPKQLD